MTNNKLGILRKYRDAILLAEIGALIHDLGKLSGEFIKQMSKDIYFNYNHEEILKDKYKNTFWFNSQVYNMLKDNHTILVKVMNSFYDFLKRNVSGFPHDKQRMEYFGEIIRKHGNPGGLFYSYFFKFSADIIDSGIDKGAASNTNRQSINHTYISTSFGYEFEKIDVNSQQLKKYRKKFIQKLQDVLNKIQELKSHNSISDEDWVNLRYELLKSARDCFTHALGETRRSANDVTLWDHSYSTASLFKSALVDIILSGQWENNLEKIKWRLLSIRFNGLDYITKSHKVGDILGRKKRLELALDLVKDLLEVYVPLGNEIYRDENGSVFLVPEIFDVNALYNLKIGEYFSLKKDIEIEISSDDTIKSAIEKIFNEVTYGELKPNINVSEPSRGAVNLGKVLEENKVLFNQPFVQEIRNTCNDKAPICKICGLKPCIKKEDGKGYYDFCGDCRKIRERRARKWYKEERIKYKSTIWIDEICDKNRRVGVIIGAFDLKYWLNGMWLNTCFTKVLDNLKKENPDIFDQICCFETLIKVVEEALSKNDPNADLSIKKKDGKPVKVKELFEKLGGESYRGQKVQEYFSAIVEYREEDVIKWAYGKDINKLSNREKAELLILALFRKNPSFARIRRIWETTKKFWDNIEDLIKKKLGVRVRYKIIINKKLSNLSENNTYELRVEGLRIPIYCSNIGDNKTELLIIENCKDLGINLEQLKYKLKSCKFEIWEDSDYSKRAKRLYPPEDSKNFSRDIQLKVEIEKDSEYIPYIQILKEPTLFIVLLPLETCWDIIKLIKKEYEKQFSKVQNRLPIKIGLIAFKRKYPLYIVMDSVKRLLKEEIGEKVFTIKRIERLPSEENCKIFNGKLGNYASFIEVECKNIRFKFYMSYSLGDPDLEDVFYPYFVIVETQNKIANLDVNAVWLYNEYITKLSIKGKELLIRHVSELKKDDIIFFEPSLFDFEFLDSNIRRFDIGKKRKHWLFVDSTNKPKPYLLWDIDNFERLRELIEKLGLTTTQIMNLYELLISKIEEWEIRKPPFELLNSGDEKEKEKAQIFKKFVENSIKNIPLRLEVVEGETCKGKISKEDFEFLKLTILTGMFFDFVDLWYTILN